MIPVWVRVIIIVLAVIIGILVALIIVGRRMQKKQQASQAHAAATQLFPRSLSVTVTTSTLHGTAVRLQSSTVFRGPYSALLRLYSARKVRSRLRKTFLTIRRMQELSLLHLTSLAFTTQAARTRLTSGSSAPIIWAAGNSLTCS